MSFLRTSAKQLLPTPVFRSCKRFLAAQVLGDNPLRFEVPLDLVLATYRRKRREIFFLQVGSFDGVSGDALYPLIERHSLRGVLIEPQRIFFERLKSNYARFGESNFNFVNAAIGATDGDFPMYCIKAGAQGPNWLHQIASFDRNTVMKHADSIPNLESLIEVEKTRCLTFDTLFSETAIRHVDFLQIDAEGLDAEILRLFDIPRRKPAIVRFEHKHLRAEDLGSSLALLRDQGYSIAICGGDVLAYHSMY